MPGLHELTAMYFSIEMHLQVKGWGSFNTYEDMDYEIIKYILYYLNQCN